MLKLGRFYKPNENDLHTNRKQMINSRFNFYFYNAVQRRASNANLRKKQLHISRRKISTRNAQIMPCSASKFTKNVLQK